MSATPAGADTLTAAPTDASTTTPAASRTGAAAPVAEARTRVTTTSVGPSAAGDGGPAEGFERLEPQTGVAFLLPAGARLTVVDPTGEQVSDFFCVMADDLREHFSSGRTIDYANSTAVTTDTVLYSNRSRPMAVVEEDTCGSHDILLTPCSQQTFDILYPDLGGAYHPGCFENLATSMAAFGVTSDTVSTTLNIFMNVWAERDGTLHIDPPTSTAGDRLTLRAEADLVVGLTACSAEKSNNGVCKPIDFRVTLPPVRGA